jgi:alcohol dehydrogenase class IV
MRNPLIVTDRGSADLPFIVTAKKSLEAAGLTVDSFSDVSPNPKDIEIERVRRCFRDGHHDGVIAMGGGSGMDAGKATTLVANNDLDVWRFNYDEASPTLPVGHVFPKLICIPTTAGTGAETESTAMITHSEAGMKLCVWHPDLKPSLTLLDPELTMGLPPQLTAWTGLDALVHAVEAYCVPDFHPMCDGIALEALTLIGRSLPAVVEEPDNIAARGGMQVGACLAGIAFLKGLGLVHAISHMVGAEYDTHHGLTNAVVLPAVLRFNEPAIAEKVPAMMRALGQPGTDFDEFYRYICGLLDRFQIPRTLSELGVPVSAAETLTTKALKDAAAGTNPRVSDADSLMTVITESITVGR